MMMSAKPTLCSTRYAVESPTRAKPKSCHAFAVHIDENVADGTRFREDLHSDLPRDGKRSSENQYLDSGLKHVGILRFVHDFVTEGDRQAVEHKVLEGQEGQQREALSLFAPKKEQQIGRGGDQYKGHRPRSAREFKKGNLAGTEQSEDRQAAPQDGFHAIGQIPHLRVAIEGKGEASSAHERGPWSKA